MSGIGSLAVGPLLDPPALARQVAKGWLAAVRVLRYGGPWTTQYLNLRTTIRLLRAATWTKTLRTIAGPSHTTTASTSIGSLPDPRAVLFDCPRYGEKLPASKRNAWLDAVEALGVDPWRDEVPVEFGQAHGGNHRAVDQRLQMGGERTGSYPR